MNNQHNKRILIIDDDPGVLRTVTRAVRFLGYEAAGSVNFPGINAVAEAAPAAILLDVFLLDEDGRDIARHLKGSDTTRSIPLIMFSAHPDIAAECHAAGADAFMSKPFGLADLEQTLARLVAPARASENSTP